MEKRFICIHVQTRLDDLVQIAISNKVIANDVTLTFFLFYQTYAIISRHQHQCDNWQIIATPRIIQCSGGLLVGNSTAITKFVECPVVDRVPRLSLVLYSGQVYVSLFSISSFLLGIIHICQEVRKEDVSTCLTLISILDPYLTQ